MQSGRAPFVVVFLLILIFSTTLIAEAPRAVVPEAVFAAGTVAQGTVLTHVFVIKNEGDAELQLKMSDISMPGVNVRYRRVMAQGTEQEIKLEWNTSKIAGELEVVSRLQTNDPRQPELVLTVKANVIPRIEVLPLPAFFFNVYRDQTAEEKREIKVNQDKPVTLTQMVSENQRFRGMLRTIEPGRRYELTVDIPRDQPAGRYEEVAILKTDDPVRPELRIPVNLLVKNDVYVMPEALDLGRISAKELNDHPDRLPLFTQSLLVKARPGRVIKVVAIESDAPALQVTKQGAGEGVQQIAVAPRIESLKPGTLDTLIRIKTDDREFPVLKVRVTGEIY